MGLHKVVDLGEWWLERNRPATGRKCIRRDLGPELTLKSVRYRKTSTASITGKKEWSTPFSRRAGSFRSGRFIGMYVNDLTLDYGPMARSRAALLEEAWKKNLIPAKSSRRVRF
jgi:1,4-dihydroxy-6-naphthoate synthase